MGQRLPSLDLSGLMQGTGNAAAITAKGGSLGIGDSVDSAISTVLKRRQLSQQDRQLDISAGHLDLAKQAEQDKRDAMTLKILDTEDSLAQQQSFGLEPDSPEFQKLNQSLEDHHVIRQTLLQRLTGSPIMQASVAEEQATKTRDAEDASWENSQKVYGDYMASRGQSAMPPAGTMPFGGTMQGGAAPASPASTPSAVPSALPNVPMDPDEQALADVLAKAKAARGRQEEFNKQALAENQNARSFKKTPAAAARLVANGKALNGQATAAAEEAARYEGFAEALKTTIGIKKQAKAQEEIGKRQVAEADAKETQATARLNEALKAGAYERIGIAKDAPPFTSIDDFKARTGFATRDTTQKAGFEHQDAVTAAKEDFQKRERLAKQEFQDHLSSLREKAKDERADASSRAAARKEHDKLLNEAIDNEEAAATDWSREYEKRKKRPDVYTADEIHEAWQRHDDAAKEHDRLLHLERTGSEAPAPKADVWSEDEAFAEAQKAATGKSLEDRRKIRAEWEAKVGQPKVAK